jgi:class 3 adenylate cyclase
MAELPSGTVTFLFTDIEGSTARWEDHPEAMRVALARHDALILAAIVEHHGHVVKTMGDAFHAAFSRAPDALAAAVDAQRRLQAEPWGEVGPLRVRMAVHTGVAEERDGDYYGPALNRAARLLATGHGGQVLLSDATTALVRETLPDDVRLRDLGQHRLRDLVEPERVVQVVAPDLPSTFLPLASLDARPHNLPTHLTSLLGRERELAEIGGLFRGGARLVTLTGPGGTGKTRLGLQVAAELLDQFEHGVYLVELASTSDPALVPNAIAEVLGVRDLGGRSMMGVLRAFSRAAPSSWFSTTSSRSCPQPRPWLISLSRALTSRCWSRVASRSDYAGSMSAPSSRWRCRTPVSRSRRRPSRAPRPPPCSCSARRQSARTSSCMMRKPSPSPRFARG